MLKQTFYLYERFSFVHRDQKSRRYVMTSLSLLLHGEKEFCLLGFIETLYLLVLISFSRCYQLL